MRVRHVTRGENPIFMYITAGKEYDVDELSSGDYKLIDDRGNVSFYSKEHFEPVIKDAGPPVVKMRCIATQHYMDLTLGKLYEGSLSESGWFQFTDDAGDGCGIPVEGVFQLVIEGPNTPLIRTFETGATRNLDHNKIDYEGFLSPTALHAFGEYMHGKRVQADGTLRASDNWAKGIPIDSYVKSMWRHMMDVWLLHRGHSPKQPETGLPVDKVEALCALMFNVQGLLHETLKGKASE